MRQVKVKKIASSISHFCEVLLEENKDLRIFKTNLISTRTSLIIGENEPSFFLVRTKNSNKNLPNWRNNYG